ncbi:MAG: hypothetical protein M3Z96_11215 [Pseudomonadota bacterium]|nr:hypothetical protein [Pseudomonadota bacterium]
MSVSANACPRNKFKWQSDRADQQLAGFGPFADANLRVAKLGGGKPPFNIGEAEQRKRVIVVTIWSPKYRATKGKVPKSLISMVGAHGLEPWTR